MKNQPCYTKDGEFLGWFSRSMATAAFLFAKDKDGDWCILGSERGEDAADFKGCWNCPCGYLECDITLAENMTKELKEEVGIDVPPSELVFYGFSDSPFNNHQNVEVLFCKLFSDKNAEDFVFSKEGNEGREVGEIKWIKMREVANYKWAFHHGEYAKEIYLEFNIEGLKA